ncbi:MAG: hypothetical protein RIB45_17835 [Marivibrio sp.]|uniref:hypothetical protein n=1 Tax=Marivibrio sp. TaxID=2039719 RepID=UPI0032F05FAC
MTAKQTGANAQATADKAAETSDAKGADAKTADAKSAKAETGPTVTAADVAKALGEKVTVRGAKGRPVERKAGADDVLGFRVHDDGKGVTATLSDGRKVEGTLS